MKRRRWLILLLSCTLTLVFVAVTLLCARSNLVSGQGAAAASAGAAESPFRLDMIGQIGGPTYAVALQGELLYFGVGPRLVIWNVADPAAPVPVGQSAPLRDAIVGIDVEGYYAYLACDQGGLRVLDVSDPAHPREMGDYQISGLPTEFFSVEVSGGYAYAVDRLRGLRVIDVSNPANPTEAGFYDTPGFAVDVTVVGNYAYVADEAYRLQIVDVTLPSNPMAVDYDSYYASADVWGVTAGGGYLYVSTSDGLDILSLADPIAPSLVGSYASVDLGLDAAVATGHAYLMGEGLEILNIADPANPYRVGAFPTRQRSGGCPAAGGNSLKPCRAVAVAGGYAYVADDAFGLHVVDVANPAAPQAAAAYQSLGRVMDVALADGYAYTVQRERGMHVVDVSNPAAPAVVGAFPLTGTVEAVAVADGTAFIGNGYPGISGLYAVSVGNPAAPVQTGYTDAVGEPNHITVRGDYAYLTTGYEWTGFQIVDVSDPTDLEPQGGVVGADMPGGGYDVALDGDRAYVADWGTARLLDVADPSAPQPLGVFDTGHIAYIYSIATDGAHVFLTDAEDFHVLDWRDPVSPTVVGGLLSGTGWGQDIGLLGDHAYVAGEQYGLFVLDISAANAVTPTQQFRTPGLALDVEVADGLVYVAMGDGGLGIFAGSPYASGSVPPGGGSLSAPDGLATYTFPAGIFTDTVVVTHTTLLPGQVPPPAGGLRVAGHAFELEATYVANGAAAMPQGSYTLTLTYDPARLGPVTETSLALYSWDGTGWQRESAGPPDTAAHTVVATPDHFSYWALLGELQRVFLPLVTAGSASGP